MTPEQIRLLNEMTPLQREVCSRVATGMGQREALIEAKRAMRKPEPTLAVADAVASRLLRHAKPAAFLESVRAAAVTKLVADRTEILEFLTRVVRTPLSALADFEKVPVKIDEATGEVLATQTVWNIKDSAMQDPQALALISELEVGKHGPKIKTHSQLQAAQMLAKLQGWEAPAKIDATIRTAKPAADMDPLEAARAYQDLMGS